MKVFWSFPPHGDSRYLGTSRGAAGLAAYEAAILDRVPGQASTEAPAVPLPARLPTQLQWAPCPRAIAPRRSGFSRGSIDGTTAMRG
ncbi:hypothetical protein [Chitinimonas koreensis]|uniref:hypothetical protein n=1 Tax=Chitinimonas koreensis TaxID=356302 RepID=UPI00041312A7|nr:hypothetical protein [Chitinimonas koreensis]